MVIVYYVCFFSSKSYFLVTAQQVFYKFSSMSQAKISWRTTGLYSMILILMRQPKRKWTQQFKTIALTSGSKVYLIYAICKSIKEKYTGVQSSTWDVKHYYHDRYGLKSQKPLWRGRVGKPRNAVLKLPNPLDLLGLVPTKGSLHMYCVRFAHWPTEEVDFSNISRLVNGDV